MMRKMVILISLFFFNKISGLSQSSTFFISTNKTFYNSDEKVDYIVTQSSTPCNGHSIPVYLEMLNSRLQTVQQQILQFKNIETKYQLSLTGLDSGYYVLRVYTKEQATYSPTSIQHIAIGVNMPSQEQKNNPELKIFLFPEGGISLINFTSRLAVFLQTQTGEPMQESLLVRNKAGQLVAICSTAANGWGAIDIPLLRNESYTIQTGKAIPLRVINTDNDAIVSDIGFSLHIEQNEQEILVEMRKAEAEQRKKTTLSVFYKNILLFESTGLFKEDTAIIATSFPYKGFENKLLRLVLKDETNIIVSERLVLIPDVKTNTDMSILRTEIFCGIIKPYGFDLDKFLPQTLNDYLISAKTTKSEKVNEETDGFSLFFLNKSLVGQTLNYSIISNLGNILQVGTATPDTSGLLEINGCTFKGNASVQFYLNGRKIQNYIKKISMPVIGYDTGSALKQMKFIIAERHILKKANKFTDFTISMQTDTQNNVKELSGITVIGVKKSRMEVLEEKYVSNGMFKDINSKSVNVEDDPAAVNYTLKDYLIKKIPGLLIRKEIARGISQDVFIYRMGYLDIYLDETPITEIPDIFMGDIGYIKFIRNPVRGGMASERGGALQKGNSFASGLQGSIAIYTRKYSENKKSNNAKDDLQVTGYVNDN